ncbi:hypothetical protein BG011_007563 [Mortierella polycephala]|uniref:Major facilitator superfamily (MFS) profile domain-containing protein n=1 Tax=Mortierella polycephala TaxID=41804 RepID=A0A9P6U8Q3_9FUNG|nr:hypothetical protein BG011_007563 [Mortierella polycephala]
MSFDDYYDYSLPHQTGNLAQGLPTSTEAIVDVILNRVPQSIIQNANYNSRRNFDRYGPDSEPQRPPGAVTCEYDLGSGATAPRSIQHGQVKVDPDCNPSHRSWVSPNDICDTKVECDEDGRRFRNDQLGAQQLAMHRTQSPMSDLICDRQFKDSKKSDDYSSEQIAFWYDAEMEATIVRKLDRHLLPLLGILYLFSYLDRVNIGNARLFGLEDSIHMTDGQYTIALGSFFLAYCIFEIPSNMILVRIGPQKWIPILMLVWGTVSLLLAWVTSFTTLLIARFALGIAEAGFVPGVLFYLTLFYKRSEHSFRIAIFLCFNILAGAFGGLFAAGIANLTGALGLQGWQWIFIIESVPTILLSVVTWFVMIPSPSMATFLTPEQRIYAANRILMDNDVLSTTHASWRQLRDALSDFRMYIFCLMSILSHMPISGVVMFMPSLISDMGFSATKAQLLTVPPYLVAACCSLVIPWWSDRTQIRSLFVIFVPIVSVIGFLLLAFSTWTWLRYLAVMLALSGLVPISAVVTSWLTNNCVGHTKRAVSLAMIVSASALSSMAGTQVYRANDAPRYQQGHLVMACSVALLITTAAVFRIILARENGRREKNLKRGLQIMTEEHLNDFGDMHPNFRYTL